MQYTVGIVSLGCPKNLVDTEVMLGLLAQEGFIITSDEQTADILIVNTCAFINDAKEESIETILELANYKVAGTCKLLIVAGCLAERYNKEILKEIPEVDAIVGTGNYHEIVQIVNKALKGDSVLKYGNQDFTPEEGLARLQTTPCHTAYLKISDGCDNRCTYCIIPKLRGKYRSRKIEDIVYEARQLAHQGVKELILIAQDTTRYGIDIYGKYKLPELLKELSSIEDIKWIRIHYSYPEYITEDLIDVIASEAKVCNYIDMPIQHCSNNILKRMGRKAEKQKIISLINNIRKKIPNIVLRTSIIVGFPGETDEDFEQLKDFVKEIQFDKMGVFRYSREEGTAAANFDNQIDEKVKDIRFNELMDIQSQISLQINQNKVGNEYNVLIEGFDSDSQFYYGRTYADSIDIDGKVFFKSQNVLDIGSFIKVNITQANEYDLIGEILNEYCE